MEMFAPHKTLETAPLGAKRFLPQRAVVPARQTSASDSLGKSRSTLRSCFFLFAWNTLEQPADARENRRAAEARWLSAWNGNAEQFVASITLRVGISTSWISRVRIGKWKALQPSIAGYFAAGGTTACLGPNRAYGLVIFLTMLPYGLEFSGVKDLRAASTDLLNHQFKGQIGAAIHNGGERV